MNLEESTNNLKYIKEILSFLNDAHEKAQTFKLDETTHNISLEKKYMKQLWDLQAETARRNIKTKEKEDAVLIPKSYYQKFINIFKDKSAKELTDFEKFNEFYNSLNDNDLQTENKLKLPSIEIEFIALRSYRPKFSETVEKVIDDHITYPYYARRYHLTENDLSILKNLKLEYLKESKDFTIKNCQKDFFEYLEKSVASFKLKNQKLKEKSLFDLYSYDAENLVRNFDVDRLENIEKLIKEKEVIYELFLQKYKKDLKDHIDLNYSNLFSLFSKNTNNTNDLIKILNKNTLMFEEYNAFSALEYNFPYYPESHDQLREIILEMKKQDLIPENIEKSIISGDKEFNIFFKRCVEKHNLHTELIEELPLNIPIKKKKLLKV
jgi:hypothetical protein